MTENRSSLQALNSHVNVHGNTFETRSPPRSKTCAQKSAYPRTASALFRPNLDLDVIKRVVDHVGTERSSSTQYDGISKPGR